MRGMNDLFRARLAVQHGVVTAADARQCGVGRESLARLVARGVLVRVHPGSFVEAERLDGATPERTHALQALAVTRSFRGRHAASHVSAVAIHGLPLVGLRTPLVHLTRTTPGRGRRTRDVVIHPASGPLPVCSVAGILAVPVARAIVQATASAGLVTGVSAADEALRRRRVTREQLRAEAALSGVRHGIGDVRTMLDMADGRSESPGESWARVLFRGLGLPEPALQAEIRDEDGWLVGRVDFLFAAQRTIVEFDGLLKYGEATARTALMAEKRREDRLTSLGYAVVRLTWSDLSRPVEVDRLIRSAFLRQTRRAG